MFKLIKCIGAGNLFLFGSSFAYCQLSNLPGAAKPSDAIVTIEKIVVKGTRFQLLSVQNLSGLRVGQKVSEAEVRKACRKLTESGLVNNVDYNYESLDDPNVVALELKIEDAMPLLPAAIKIPGLDAEDIWRYLEGIDPLFTRKLPRTERALNFYSRFIERYLKTLNRSDRIISEVIADSNNLAVGIVFEPGKVMPEPRPTKRKK